MPNKVLLINPSYSPSYGGTKVGIVNPICPTLGLATIAATAVERGHKVEILDLSWRPYDFQLVRDRILQSKPDIVIVNESWLNEHIHNNINYSKFFGKSMKIF